MDRRSFLTLVGLAACGRRATPPPAPDAAPDAPAAPEVEEDFPASPPPLDSLPEGALDGLGEASARLASALWPALRGGPGNPQWSPAVAVTNLAVVAAMARPEVAARVHTFLGVAGSRADTDRRVGGLLRPWVGAFDGPGFVALQRPFVARGARLSAEVRGRLRATYGAPAALVDADGNEGVRARIHGFFSARTGGVAARLVALEGVVPNVPAHVVSAARAAVVVRGVRGAMSFRVGGAWPIDVAAVVVPAGATVARAGEATAVRVPLVDVARTLDLLVPDEGRRLDAVEPDAFAALLDRRRATTPARGAVVFPAVDTAPTEATRLRDALWAAGLAEPFDPERSPLAAEGIARAWVSEVFHWVRASLSAEGPPEGAPGPVALRVDRPFTWALRDARHGAVLALGRVFDPRE